MSAGGAARCSAAGLLALAGGDHRVSGLLDPVMHEAVPTHEQHRGPLPSLHGLQRGHGEHEDTGNDDGQDYAETEQL